MYLVLSINQDSRPFITYDNEILQKNLKDEERVHLISVLDGLHEQVNREESEIAVESKESLLDKGEKIEQRTTFYQYI